MDVTWATAFMAIVALVSAGAVWAQRDTVRAEWTDATSFVLIVGWATIAGYSVGILTGETQLDHVDGMEVLSYGPFAGQLLQLALPVACASSAVFILRAFHRREASLAPAGLLALAVWVLGALNNATSGQPVVSWGLLTTGVVLAAATLLEPGRGAILGAGLLGVSVAVASGLAGFLNWSVATRACRFDKCGPLGVLFRGVTGNENALAMLLAMSLPFVLLTFRGRARLLLPAFLAGMVWVTGSRSSWAAVAAVLAVAAVCRPREVGGIWVGRAKPLAVSCDDRGAARERCAPLAR